LLMFTLRLFNVDGVFEFEEDHHCLVPDGRYIVNFSYYRTMLMLKGIPKIEIGFKICDDDTSLNGLILPKWYNAIKCNKPRKNGNFKVGKRSNFSMDFTRLFNHDIKRKDRVPMSYFDKYYYLIETETVTSNFQQKKYPEQLQYSKVKEIIKAVELSPIP